MNPQLNRQELLARLGLRLPAVTLKRLQSAGIFCQPEVSVQYQQHAHSYVLRAVESGGAIAELGAYCGFVGADGNALTRSERVNNLAVNGLHAIVMEPALVRLQMVRNRLSYQLLITRHSLSSVAQRHRPQLQSSILFHGHGSATIMSNDAESATKSFAPLYSRNSGTTAVPAEFLDAIQQLVAALWCVGCRHSHLSRAPEKNVTESPVTGV